MAIEIHPQNNTTMKNHLNINTGQNKNQELNIILQKVSALKNNQYMRIVVIGLILAIGTSSCKKDFVPTPPKATTVVTATQDLKVAATFDWATTRTMDIEITPAAKGLLLIQDEKASAIYKAFVGEGQTHTAHITFGSTVTKAYIYFNGVKEEITIGGKKFVSSLK